MLASLFQCFQIMNAASLSSIRTIHLYGLPHSIPKTTIETKAVGADEWLKWDKNQTGVLNRTTQSGSKDTTHRPPWIARACSASHVKKPPIDRHNPTLHAAANDRPTKHTQTHPYPKPLELLPQNVLEGKLLLLHHLRILPVPRRDLVDRDGLAQRRGGLLAGGEPCVFCVLYFVFCILSLVFSIWKGGMRWLIG